MDKLYKLITKKNKLNDENAKQPTPAFHEPGKEVINRILAYSLKTSPQMGLMN